MPRGNLTFLPNEGLLPNQRLQPAGAWGTDACLTAGV